MPQIPSQPVGCLDRKEEGNEVHETTLQRTQDRRQDINDNEHTKELVVSWLAQCFKNSNGKHDICNQGVDGYIPTRLLDVRHALEKNVVRIVCSDKEDETFTGIEYATLSYCRGPHAAEQNPMLVTNNLEICQTKGFNWDHLPKTFQDAFKIASWLELNWIWIDSMCIVQDSKSDWKIETRMMDQIYMGAKINISADIGVDSQAGCFAQRTNTDITPLQLVDRSLEKEWAVTTDDTFEWMNSAPSIRRAWIHRERQTSRRIIHCTAKEMVWECCGFDNARFASETMPQGSPFEKIFNGETNFQTQIAHASDRNLRGSERRERLHMLWNSNCQDFTNKSVSQTSDMPYILWGMAFRFHTLFRGEEYGCGHWRSNLAESLTWWIPGVKPECEDYLAPSWSWLSAGCPVQLVHLDLRRHKRAVVDILSISRGFESYLDDGFGKHAFGSMSVNGFLRKVRFDYKGPQEDVITLSVVEEDEHGNPRIRSIGRNINLNRDLLFRLTMDRYEKLPSRGLECYALFTTLHESAKDEAECQRQLACILLEHDSVIHNGPYQYHTYKRIGTIDEISDLYSLKLRYRVAPSAKILEVGVLQDDIWALLSQYLSCIRRTVIREFMESGIPDSSGYSTCEQSETDESEWDECSLQSRPESTTGVINKKDEEDVRSVSSEIFNESKDLPQDMNATSGQEQVDDVARRHRLQLLDLRNIIMQIHDHPSSGLRPISDGENNDEASNHLQQLISFQSQTVAYGNNIKEDPKCVMYQFDDVLDMWQKQYGVVPWLEELETSEFKIV
ncbi:hypothetical protein FVEN_g6506 [Fusarium venenatum]|uniref:Heterokaryon incompatibility domain-containing protein n=1 Tax=Fusarium venenatum TaxID=56646 RepID=A0A2L2TJC6_9HYPO|nr:uncharacterized protein FVRRES_04786 [Fusarium venenatum]KAG8355653.1 hypothetical protein FVEN_g6506 [Fusarium venenatum]KAH6991934.1 heterokaryon incompatibility protein-domain-containing protein [Fusarium venenatum]CEI60350.1 unnamed protein product [Fusarium venenatum]